MRNALVLVMFVVACGKGDGKKEAPSGEPAKSEPPKAASLSSLKVRINGKDAPMQKAFIKRIPGGDRYQVYVVDGPGTCQELIDNVFNNRDLPYILFNVGQRMGADGAINTVVTDVFIKGSGDVAPGSTATIGTTADLGMTTAIAVEYSATSGDQKYEVSGAFAADGCGERAEPPLLKAKHLSMATIAIAGNIIPLVGARRTKDRFLLTTSEIDCSPSTPFAKAVLRKEYGSWELGGTLFAASTKDKDKEMAEVTITPGKTGTSDDGPTVELTVSGKGTMGGHLVILDGMIVALDCPDN